MNRLKKRLFWILSLSMLGALAWQLDLQNYNKDGCPFCKESVLAEQLFFEGDQVLGILTHKPAVPGHVLIIPRRHVERLEALSEAEWAEIAKVIGQVDRAVKKAFGYKDYLIIEKNGRMAGQSVPHVHFHYVPGAKFLAARFFISPWLKPISHEEAKLLRETLAGSF